TTGAPVADARVTVVSPSQNGSTRTDGSGHFVFVSLAPDTYTVTVEKAGYTLASQSGIVVVADAQAVASMKLAKTLQQIGGTTARSASNLVHAGTTADVYSVNAATQDKVSSLGGGGGLNSAYAGIASVPGAVLPMNQTGYNQTVSIRGGNYNQVGFEFDGVPVNRAFDNAPSAALSSLGQQELQVYTGATPANSEGQGLSGYINQVIKTGTYPASETLTGSIGGPTYYHKATAEAGGANRARTFSYYVGVGGYDQQFRYVDDNNAVGYSRYGQVLNYVASPTGCTGTATDNNYSACYANGFGPGGYAMAPYNFGYQSGIQSRDALVNLHIGLPQKNGNRDDVQLLWDSQLLHNTFYSSVNDLGGPAAVINVFGVPATWTDGFLYHGALGQTVPLTFDFANQIGPYFFPSSPTGRLPGSPLPVDARDSQWNGQSIFKLQYQKNIGSNAYLRLYGYTYYSENIQNGPMSAFLSTGAGGNLAQTSASRDYTVGAHTRGVALAFSDQLTPKNLLNVAANVTGATSTRSNATTMLDGSGSGSRFAVLVDPNNLMSGICYKYAAGAATPTTCTVNASKSSLATWLSLSNPTNAVPAGTLCGPDPCQYFLAENGMRASYNAVSPTFSALSVTDEWRPNDKLLLSFGVRNDQFRFNDADTRPGDPARQFWFAAFNHDFCISNATGAPVANNPTTACPAGTTVPNLQNVSRQSNTYNVFQPRLSGTYTFDPDTVARFSYGKYVEPPTSAEQQFDTQQENLAAYLGTNFYHFGFTTPGHDIRPSISDNYDFSIEHHFKNSDWSMKLTPFYRRTKDQTQSFYLDQQSGFTAYLNVGSQTSKGVEFQLNKGDFSRNGLAALLALTYTDSNIVYNRLSNGTTIVSQMNQDIVNYNSYTSYCASHATDKKCAGGSQTGSAAPCYDTSGNPDPGCAAGDIANPYWNAPVQGLLDPTARYAPYDLFPGPVGGAADSFAVPYAAVLVLNYKHDKLAITPNFQFQGGGRYGSPESMIGVDPASGCAALTGSTTNDPRYPYGASAGLPYDATTCAGTIPVPNRFTNRFDGIGAFVNPAQFMANLQVSYQVSRKVTLVATFANLVNTCFGGTKAAWTYNDHNVCSYGVNNTQGGILPVANVYNPGSAFQPVAEFPYGAYLGAYNDAENSTKMPFNVFVEARIKM
ncbi:MAG: TonB-dependent receptor, partial [Candidatus Eremiobacteraeota bacterium]|nr:TonB-dependent receptor [Candidatus Eremiobacteraeota bacterium]